MPEETPAPAIERLTAADLAAIRALHARVLDTLPAPGLIKPETEAFHRLVLEEGHGLVFGVRDPAAPDRLLSYGVLLLRLVAGDGSGRRLGLPETAPLCKIAGTSVAPEARGRGHQRALLARRIAAAAEAGKPFVYGTVAPANGPSCRNMVRAGFRIHRVERRYGGLLRYLTLHRPGMRPPPPEAVAAWVPGGDAAAVEELTAAGFVGASVRRGPAGGHELGFLAPSADQAEATATRAAGRSS